MSKTSKTVLILVILIGLVIIIALAVNGGGETIPNEDDRIEEMVENENEEAEEEVDEVVQDEEPAPEEEDASQTVSISYTDSGFTPNSVTINAGDTVRWTNNSSGGMWVASDIHPTHEILPGFDQLGSGNSYSYTFEEAGRWTFHNHVNARHTGTVIVQ